MMKKRIPGRNVCVSVIMVLLVILSAGCSAKKEDAGYKSLGMDHGVEGFLYNFDQRSEVRTLVGCYKKNQLPVSVTWVYGKNAKAAGGTGPDREKVEISEDPQVIREIYYALSNTIIIGVASDQRDDVRYYVSFALPDAGECRFDFVSENTIRIGNQNYVAESDGNLWTYLAQLEESQETALTEDLT